MTSFTPGPWRAVDQRTHHSIHGAGDASLCDVLSYSFGNGPDRDRRGANAALIAAAPDLYEALNAAFHAKIIYVGGGPEESIAECGIGGDLEIVRQLMSAALAKVGVDPDKEASND